MLRDENALILIPLEQRQNELRLIMVEEQVRTEISEVRFPIWTSVLTVLLYSFSYLQKYIKLKDAIEHGNKGRATAYALSIC